jgi:hypothetical protein
MLMKNSNATIGNRTLNLPDCVAAPRPSAPRRDVPTFSLICCTFALISASLSHLLRSKYHEDPSYVIFSFLALPSKLLYTLLRNFPKLRIFFTACDRFERSNKNIVPRYNFVYLSKPLTPDYSSLECLNTTPTAKTMYEGVSKIFRTMYTAVVVARSTGRP